MRAVFLDALSRHRAIAVLRSRHAGPAAAAMSAAVDEGFHLLQFSWDAPATRQLIAEFSRRPGLLVGAGDVLDPADVDAATAVGAAFLTTPAFDRRLATRARDLGVALLSGSFTPTEMVQAHEAGAAGQLLLPAVPDIAGHVRAVLAPLPFLRIVAADGVDAHNAAEILAAGAAAVGFTTALFDPIAIEARRLDTIRNHARTLLASIQHFAFDPVQRGAVGVGRR